MKSPISRWARGIPVIVLLLALVVPPLAGSAVFVNDDIASARHEKEQALEIRTEVGDVLALFELRVAVVEEHSARLVLSSLEGLGLVSPDLVQLIGIDPVEALRISSSSTDRLLERVDDLDLSRSVVAYRDAAPDTPNEDAAAFPTIVRAVSQTIDARLTTLHASASALEGGAETALSIEVLRAVGDAQHAIAASSIDLFVSIDLRNADTEEGRASRVGLITKTSELRQALELFEQKNPSAKLVDVIEGIEADPATLRYQAMVDQQVSSIVDGTSGQRLLVTNLDSLLGLFADTAWVVGSFSEPIDLAAEQVTTSSTSLVADAESRASARIRSLVVLTLITLGFTTVVTYLIARPSRRLATGAERIEQGDTTHRILERGPAELRDAARALNGATATLHLVEHQARQMAQGSLAADEVTKATNGPLGDSLRSAIETLAESITEREELRHDLAHEASHDGLTGLANRTAVLDRLDESFKRSQRSDGHVAVMFLDLDRFKSVNDQHGHAVGDVVLRTIAERFQSVARAGDTVGRIGGDEFLLVAEPVADVVEALAIAERIVDAADRPVATDEAAVSIGVSVGIALSGPGSTNSTELLNAADVAVYRAKDDPERQIVVAPGVDSGAHTFAASQQ